MAGSALTRLLGVAFIVLAAASCASSGGTTAETAAGAGDGAVSIQVTNDLVPPYPITVWIVPETGSRRRLGTIEPNGQQTFAFTPVSASMDHRLQAEYSAQRTGLEASSSTPSSNPFSLDRVTVAKWRVSTSVVTIER